MSLCSTKLVWRFGVVAVLGLLAGCAGVRTGSSVQSFDASRQALYGLKAWRMEGRIGVKTGGNAWQANLAWEHEASQDRLRVSGPLNQGGVSIVVQKDLIYINEGEGKTLLSRQPDATLRERLGFAVPLGSLRYWILGIPDPIPPSTPIAVGDGAETGFRQLGWEVLLDKSQTIGQRSLPQRLRVRGAGVMLKIVADDWDIKG